MNTDVTSSFIRLDWLPIKFRINFKIALFQIHSWTRPQLSKKHGRHQEDFDIQPSLKHQYPVGKPFTTIEKNTSTIHSLKLTTKRISKSRAETWLRIDGKLGTVEEERIG